MIQSHIKAEVEQQQLTDGKDGNIDGEAAKSVESNHGDKLDDANDPQQDDHRQVNEAESSPGSQPTF